MPAPRAKTKKGSLFLTRIIMEEWERPYIRSRDSVQILVLPPNEPVTSHGLSRPELPLIENTASWLCSLPVPCIGTWDLVSSQGQRVFSVE